MGFDSICLVFLELGLCLKAKVFWCLGARDFGLVEVEPEQRASEAASEERPC